jgi:hypothetical protein
MRALPVLKRDSGSNSTESNTSFINDAEAPDQLRILSLGPGENLADSKGYKYDSVAGGGINIYVVDSGLTPTSPVSQVCRY